MYSYDHRKQLLPIEDHDARSIYRLLEKMRTAFDDLQDMVKRVHWEQDEEIEETLDKLKDILSEAEIVLDIRIENNPMLY